MKTLSKLTLVITIVCASYLGKAQSTVNRSTRTRIPAPSDFEVIDQDANSRVLQSKSYEIGPSGEVLTNIHTYTELATGLNYHRDGKWMEASERIEILPNGTAAATNGQHQVYFPGDIYQGQIEMILKDGKHLKSRPALLSYYDGDKSVLIAELTNSVGVVVGDNQVVYKNAFTDFKVDLRYTYTRNGFEQDIILRQQPPTPESLGLNPDTARLEILTEFFSPPQPNIESKRLAPQAGLALYDQKLDFGTMQMVPGRAFLMGRNAKEAGAQVNKQWLLMDGRQFLVEQVPVNAIVNDLIELPLTAVNSGPSKNSRTASKKLALPPQRMAVNSTAKPILMAKADSAKGFVMDYQTLNTSQSSYTFKCDTTYYLSGNVSLTGTNTFEGGTVIKYASGVTLTLGGQINWLADSYRPVILTSKNDNSVGETISGSSGIPGYSAATALSVSSMTTLKLSGLRISYANTAISVSSTALTVNNGQILNCGVGIKADGGTYNVLNNSLLANVATNFFLTEGFSTSTIMEANNVTLCNSGYLLYTNSNQAMATNEPPPDYIVGHNFGANLNIQQPPPNQPATHPSKLYLTNCILANVTNVANVTAARYNGFYRTTMFGSTTVTNTFYPFQTAGAGSFYLTNGCAFTNWGTSNLDLTLLKDLRQKTTWPPSIYSNFSISVSTNFSPQVQRDTNSNPTLGFHYDPLDYLVDKLTITNGILTVTNGAAIACYNEPGLQLQNGSSIVSIGTPLLPNWFVRYQSVQEQAIVLGGTNISSGQTVSSSGGALALFQFSKFAGPAFGGFHLYDTGSAYYTNLTVKHSEFWGGQNFLTGSTNTTATLVNNLFYRSSLTATATNLTSSLYLTNNLIFGSAVILAQPTNSVWYAFNNDFDGSTLTNSTLTNGYNAYLNTSGRLNPTNVHDVVTTTNLAYQTGPLGRFYQPANSPLFNLGSTNANLLGLFHFTTQTNQVKETNSLVDVGYHYVATDTNGIPLDANGDGFPDYFEDANGNGLVDGSELSWTNLDLDGDGIPNSWEIAHGLDQLNATDALLDLDYDGRNNLQEYQDGTDPFNANSFSPVKLSLYPFDNTNSWAGSAGQLPLLTSNVSGIPSWNTNALRINSPDPALLKYRDVETNGIANINVRKGTVCFWFKPDWTSTNDGVAHGEGRLLELGGKGSADGWWGLTVTPAGTNLYFATQTNSITTLTTNLATSIGWISNVWHQVALTYSSTNTSLYVDGMVVVSNGIGIAYYPGLPTRTNGFTVGGSASGTNQAKGQFDELETYNYVLSAATISSNYLAAINQDKNGNGLPDLWELQNFGYWGVNQNADPDGDGFSNLQEWQNGTDPNKFDAVRLGHWRFDDAPLWSEDAGLLPLNAYHVSPVTSWTGDAVKILSEQGGRLAYPGYRTNGCPVMLSSNGMGTIRFWYKPDWTSVNLNYDATSGVGPQDIIRLLEIGHQSSDYTFGWFALTINRTGTSLKFQTEAAGTNLENAAYPINFDSKSWHQIVLTYTATNSFLYVDGARLSLAGLGVTNIPSQMLVQRGIFLGSSWDGAHQANGSFDEMEAFNYPLSELNIMTNYQAVLNVDTDGDGLPDVVENGMGSRSDAIDSDCDGLPDAYEVMNGLNPANPNDATTSALASYASGTNSLAPNFNLFTDQTNLINVAFANLVPGSSVYGAVIKGYATNDDWTFCNSGSDYLHGISLPDAGTNSTSIKLFGFVGPCRNAFVDETADWQSHPIYVDYGHYLIGFLWWENIVSSSPNKYLKGNNAYCVTYYPGAVDWAYNWWYAYYTHWIDWYFYGFYDVWKYQAYDNAMAELLGYDPVHYFFISGYSHYLGFYYDEFGNPGSFFNLDDAHQAALNSAFGYSDLYADNLYDYINRPGHMNSDGSTSVPYGIANCYLPPFENVSHITNNLAGKDGASWIYPSSSDTQAGGWFKALYPQAKRTLLISGITNNCKILVYYNCPVTVRPAIINDVASVNQATPNGLKYWYATVTPKSLLAANSVSKSLFSSVPVWAVSNYTSLGAQTLPGYVQIDIDSPYIYDSAVDVKILGIQIVKAGALSSEASTLSVTGGHGVAYLNWAQSAAATNYNIYRATGTPVTWTLIGSTTNLSYQDSSLAVGVTYFYKIAGVDPGTVLEPYSAVVACIPFGCPDPLPPRIDYVNDLQIPPVNGTYVLNYQTFMTNSDAFDPQGYHLVFKVDSVMSGSLMINGSPFGSGNNTIETNSAIVWIPPSSMPARGTPALRVFVYNSIQRSLKTVDVVIKQEPKRHLYGWGNDFYGAIGDGIICYDRVSGTYYNKVDEQSICNLIPRDPRWQTLWHDSPLLFAAQPRQVLDLDAVSQVNSDGYFSSAIGSNGQLWQWGTESVSFGKKFVQHNDVSNESRIYIWKFGDPAPNSYTADGFYPLLIASPLACQIPNLGSVGDYARTIPFGDYNLGCEKPMVWGSQSPMNDVKAVAGNFGYQIVLKGDGSLWSWGFQFLGELGRDPQADDDKLGNYGMRPNQIEIDGNNSLEVLPGRKFVELQTGNFMGVARCQDGTVWTWGCMDGWLNWADDTAPVYFRIAGDLATPWKPARITSLEDDNAAPITQISAFGNHLVVLREDGSVSELGYVASSDPGGAPTLDLGVAAYDELTTFYKSSPVSVSGLPKNIRQIAASGAFGVAVTEDGNVWVWGYFNDSVDPGLRQITTLKSIVKIAVGTDYILALDARGRVYGVGYQEGVFGSYCSYNQNAFRIQGIENATDIFGSKGGYDLGFAVASVVQDEPVGLAATPMNQAVALSWSNYPAASSYVIYRSLNEDSGYVALGNSTLNEYLDQDPPLQNGQIYYYQVAAVVNGVETMPSWDVAATPYPSPSSVTSLNASWTCHGSKLHWHTSDNASVSPLEQYVVIRDGLELADLLPNVTNYYDLTAEAGSNYLYTVVALNSAGQAAASIELDSSSPTVGCQPAPFVSTNASSSWLAVSHVNGDDNLGTDKATLLWAGPTNGNWLFQKSEFDSEYISSFVNLLSQADASNPDSLSAWLWAQFVANQVDTNTLTDSYALDKVKVGIMVGALNKVLTNGLSINDLEFFTEAVASGSFYDGYTYGTLRQATTNLFNTTPTGADLVRLKRMLLDDCFYNGYYYFTRGPNWGGELTGFRIHYRTSQFIGGRKMSISYHQDVALDKMTYGDSVYPDEGSSCKLYQFAWKIPQGAVCWASVGAIVQNEESELSDEAGPKAANSYSGWNPSLRAIPNYHQVYLDWEEDPNAISYNVYYSTNSDDTNSWYLYPGGGTWEPVPDGTVAMNRFWHTNLPVGTTYYYFVEANDYFSGNQYSQPAFAAATGVPPNANFFSAFASAYDGMILAEWTVPTNTVTVNDTSINQTNWQFFVERKPADSDDGNYQMITGTGYGLAYLDSDVLNGQSYTYRVTAFDYLFNRIQSLAVAKGGSSTQITPSSTNGLTLLSPVPGNGYVDLTWSPIRATQFTIKHSLSPDGPFDVIDSLNVNNVYQSAKNTYQASGLQNGVMHYYQVTATTPTGFTIDSDIKGAMPLSTLAPLPPINFRGTIMPVQGTNTVLLDWDARPVAAKYQVFLENQTGMTPLFTGIGTSCRYIVPDGADDSTVFTFAIRSVNAQGLAGGFMETLVTNKASYPYPLEGVDQPVVLNVAGVLSSVPDALLTVTGPTNLILSAQVNVPGIQQVSFYSDGQLLGTATSEPYQMTWNHVPASSDNAHLVTAVALASTQGGAYSYLGGYIASFSSDPINLTVNVEPELAAYQTASTDLQLPAPSLPISISRSYNSRSTDVNGVLGIGWTPIWNVGSVKLSAELGSEWNGVIQTILGSPHYYVGESSSHFVTVTLPSGQGIGFSPMLELTKNGISGSMIFDEDDEAAFSFESFAPGQGNLTTGNDSLQFDHDIIDLADDWEGVSFKTFDPAQFTYTSPEGTIYIYGQQGSDSLTWLITQVKDRNGNSLNYTYDTGKNVTVISNSCGRKVTFGYTPTAHGTNISVTNNMGGLPVVVYVVSNNLLTEVHQLIDRSGSGTYQTNKYTYGTVGADANRLTDIFDARGVRILHNIYTNAADATDHFTGDVMMQISPGRTNTFQVDENYNLTVTTSSSTATNTAKVNSDASGAISGATVPASGNDPSSTNAVQTSYDSQGNLISQTDANGNAKTYIYDDQNRLVGQSDENGNSTAVALNDFGQPNISTDANGKQTLYQYDNAGNPTSVKDPSGTATIYAYSDPVTSSGSYLGVMLTRQSQNAPFVPYTIVTVNSYNTSGAIKGDLATSIEEWVDTSGNVVGTPVTTSYTYDANGNRLTEIKTRTVTGGTQTIHNEYFYDAQNRVTNTVIWADGVESLARQTNSVTYNLLGKQFTSTDAAGRTTTSIYDFNGSLIETAYPDGTVSRTCYDGFGQQDYVQERTVPAGNDTTAPATRNSYDASGRVIKVEKFASVTLTKSSATAGTDYVGLSGELKMVASNPGAVLTTTRTFYDAVGRVQFSVDARGAVTQYLYDAAGRRTNVLVYTSYSFDPTSAGSLAPSSSDAFQSTSYAYDANGNQTTVTDAAGHTTTSVYDDANRVKEVDYPTDNGTVGRYTYYDGLGRKIQEVDEAGVSTAYTYDFRGLLTSVTLAFGTTQTVTTVYAYDELGNMVRQTDAAGHSTTFKYDALGRRTSRLLPDGQREGYFYDSNTGNLLYQTNFNGVVITNQYDFASSRLTNCSAPGYQTTYAYSPTGLRTNMADASGSTAYRYNALSQLTNKMVAWVGGPTVALNYGYSPLGNLTNLWSSSANGVSNLYQSDLFGRITNVLANGSAAASYGFDMVGNLQTLRYGNGVTNLCQYDLRNRLTNLVWKSGGAALASFGYTVGVTGNRTASSETVNSSSRTYNWAYDYLYRLTGESIGSLGTVNYGFDAVGNRTNRTSSVSGIANQAPTFTPNDWLASDTYDSNGNTTVSGTGNYQYDALNHLTNVNSGSIVITYDGDGNRVSKKVGSTTTYYLVDDRNPSGYAQVLEEWMSTGTPALSRVYNYGLALISQRQVSSGTVSYFGSDGHGSTRFLLNTSGGITDTYAYDSYGLPVATSITTSNNYLYCGQQFDSDLSFYYLRARYYKPDSGRFWTMDSYDGGSEDPLSLHKYLYAQDNPINGWDPSGHDDVSLGGLMTASAIGATIGAFSSAAVNVAQGRAITAASIFQGAALGAVLGPLAYAAPAVGVGLGVGGAIYSGLSFGPILLDPGATTQQKIASGALIIASIYGAKAGFDYAKAANARVIPTTPPDPTYVTLEHGTTLASASKIFVNGPDENFIRPGETTSAGGFSTSTVGADTPIGSASQYAMGKALVAPDEGGPAVLRIAVPKSIYDKAIKVGNEVRFEKGRGLEELQAAWKTSIWRAVPKQ